MLSLPQSAIRLPLRVSRAFLGEIGVGMERVVLHCVLVSDSGLIKFWPGAYHHLEVH